MSAIDQLKIAHAGSDVLALGGYLKNRVALAKGDRILLSQGQGDLDNPEAVRAFAQSAANLVEAYCAKPRIIAHDLHPDFPSTRHAQSLASLWGVKSLPVQHHHAHVAAVAAEHGVTGSLLGLALDGFGLGLDGGAWGGELLLDEGAGFRRLGRLAPLRQPGGDKAAREPWRMAAAALFALGRGAEIPARFAGLAAAKLLPQMLEKERLSPPTSSAGRLFDAACGLLGIYPVADFEGQAPAALEALAREPRILPGGWKITDGLLDMKPLLAALVDETDSVAGANLFHGTLIAGLADWAIKAAHATGQAQVALSGGCFFNQVLTQGLTAALTAQGLGVLFPHFAGPGDAGLAVGQAWIARRLGP